MDVSLFEKLLITLKNAWETLYEVTLAQVYVDLANILLFLFIMAVLTVIFLLQLKKSILYTESYKMAYGMQERYAGHSVVVEYMKNNKMKSYYGSYLDDDDMEPVNGTFFALSIVCGFILLLSIFLSFSTITTTLFNPDWAVIEKLLRLIQ